MAFRERRYLDDPPTAEELDAVLRALGREPWEVARLGEPVARSWAFATGRRTGIGGSPRWSRTPS